MLHSFVRFSFISLSVLGSVPAFAAVDSSAAEAPQTPEIPKFYIKGGLGSMDTTGKDYSTNSAGVSASISAGLYLNPRWMLGAFYRDAVSTNADMGLFGGGTYASSMYGLETEYSVVHGHRDELRLGLKGSRISVAGFNSVLFIPYSVSDLKTWGFGPSLSYFHFFGERFALGLEISYLQALAQDGSTYAVSTSNSSQSYTPHVSSFGIADVSLSLQFRFR